MLLSRAISILTLALTAVASQSQNPIRTSDDPIPVPGDNPLTFCGPPEDYKLTIKQLDINPNPPEAYVPFQKLVSTFVADLIIAART
jgi:hypothetical protein